MNYAELGLNRLGRKNEQTTPPEDVVVDSSSNPKDNVFSKFSQNGVDNGKSDAKNILTGTVITSCFIRTTDLPARVEMSGNDIRMYDDSKGSLNTVTGDTSSINFIRSDQNPGAFIIQKRHGKDFNLDNVTEMFYTDNTTPRFNYLYIGRRGNDTEYHTNYIELNAEHDTNKINDPANGQMRFNITRDGVLYANSGISITDGDALKIPQGAGARVSIGGEGDGGGIQLAYYRNIGDTSPASYIILDKDGLQVFPAISGGIAGRITAAGVADITLPSGWSIDAHTITGYYVIRRPADNTNHAVTVSAMQAGRFGILNQMSSNLFSVFMYDLAGTPTDTQFNFIFV